MLLEDERVPEIVDQFVLNLGLKSTSLICSSDKKSIKEAVLDSYLAHSKNILSFHSAYLKNDYFICG